MQARFFGKFSPFDAHIRDRWRFLFLSIDNFLLVLYNIMRNIKLLEDF